QSTACIMGPRLGAGDLVRGDGPAAAAVPPGNACSQRFAAIAAVSEPTCGTTGATVVAVTAATDNAALTARTGSTGTGAGVFGVTPTLSDEEPAVRVVGRAVADETPTGILGFVRGCDVADDNSRLPHGRGSRQWR
ncbi:MAG: hypothetical protein KIH64_015800, partial [Mycobacterium sp.]|nr:hypothetical protein [Mycobacterium sp.]